MWSCICKNGRGHPHDHGPSWAIYGQTTGETEMTDWEIVKKERDITTVKPNKTYLMKPGDVHFYNIGAVHSPMKKILLGS